jgi:exodeoxyribonuclease VII small subunit
MASKDGQQSFEELYRSLEETVGKLEKGGLPLEESIALYEQGMELAKRCQSLLDKAELRITKLRESFGQQPVAATPEPADTDDDGFFD